MSALRGREVHLSRWMLVLLLLLVGIVAFLIGRGQSPDAETNANPPAPSQSGEPTAATDESSAVRAATLYARIMAGPSADSEAYLVDMRAIAADQWKARAEELARNGSEFVADRYGQDGAVEFQPVRYRVRSFSEQAAVIDIWGVVLASGSKLGGIEESWITGTVNLVWVGSEWKVSGQSSEGGPTPELLRTEGTGSVDEVLMDFKEYDDAPGS